MNIVLQLAAIALLPVAVSAFFYLIEKRTAFGSIKYGTKQLIYGVVFGALAVIGTEFGVNMGGAVANTRAASVLSAGLIFGAPAGIIAGLIGGIERYFAVYWGAGMYTRLACTISTILAGLLGAMFRKYMFEDKKPSTFYALAIGLIAEVFHMLMVFLTNMSDVEQAFSFVELCALPMITINGIAVMLSVFAVTLIGKERVMNHTSTKQITAVFQRWLLICVALAFLITGAFTFVLQYEIAENEADVLLDLNIQDVMKDISEASDENMLLLAKVAVKDYEQGLSIADIAKKYSLSEVNIVDEKGIIFDTLSPQYMGYDMASGKQSAEFLVLLEGAENYVQEYQSTSYDGRIKRKYAGGALAEGGFIQVGYDSMRFQKDIDSAVVGATRNRHVGQKGYVIIVDEDFIIVSDRSDNAEKSEFEGKNLMMTGLYIDTDKIPEGKRFTAEVRDEVCYCEYRFTEGYYIISVLPKSEVVFARNLSIYVTVFMEIIVFAGLFILIYFLIKELVVKNIRKINQSLAEITGGNLDVVVDVRSNEEFASLSDDINTTVTALKHYIDEAAARIDQELAIAKSIQHSALPSVFPPYPNRTEMDIFALMETAKEVGGDFYDFYFVGKNKLAFLIADVSGKGIPAAMFMMTAKTVIKSLAEAGKDVDEVFREANEELCANNEANMFVTAWLAFIDLKTGLVEYVNAGHNPPLLKRKDGGFTYLIDGPDFVLAAMEGMPYHKNTVQLSAGDEIFLYTDGVTEATDLNETLYGEERLQAILNETTTSDVKELCDAVKADMDKFVGDAPQFDDITMLHFRYLGSEENKSV